MTERCKEMLRGEGSWGSLHRHQCARKAKKDGKCGIHHPDAVQRRKEITEARYKKWSAEQDEKWNREAFDRRAGDMCRELGIEPEEIKA